MTEFLDEAIAHGVPAACASFDPKVVQDQLALIAFTEPDDDLSEFDPTGVCSQIAFRIAADRDPEALDTSLSAGDWGALESIVRWSLPWTHDGLDDAPSDLVWRLAIDHGDFDRDDIVALALAEPVEFARKFFTEDISTDWIYDRETLAVLFGGWGPNDFITPMCGVPDDVFELLAPFAVTSGWFLATLPQLTTADLQTIAQNPDHARSFQDQFLFCYALDEREEMQNALVQAAAVSELSSRAEDHPAIDGCPGTGSTISDEEADEIEQLLPAESVEAAARFAIVDAALTRRGYGDRAAETVAEVEPRSLDAIDRYLANSDPAQSLRWFENCDPLLGECFRMVIAGQLLRER